MPITRRSALQRTAALSVGAAFSSITSLRAANAAGKKLRVAVVALGRGMAHVQTVLKLPDVEIVYLAEVDPKRLEIGLKAVTDKQGSSCEGVKDFRTMLDDKTLDAVFIAAPNYWHTPMALLAMQAGKHVYVEKPGSQNPREAEMIVEAVKKYGRVVQMGNQRRTWMKEAIAALHGGAIGKVHFARAFYYNARQAVGQSAKKAAPDIDMNLWQGPVPDERDMKAYIHYDWHWLWHWGNGELGNNGIHSLDILRWGLQVEYPKRVTYNGGRYWFDDKQETPDTGTAVFDFGEAGMEWVQSSSHPRSAEKPLAECLFYGEGGTFAIARDSWTIYDNKGAKSGEGKGAAGGDAAHMGNFLETIRGNAQLNSPIEEGQKSTMLCHLGNIAYRTNTVVECDPKTGKLINNPAGEKLWKREYRKGWEPTV
ncbi:MAG: Gfo/Idh/MocA family oxidoreductase [Verrucomicrobiota bacterium]|nr:Gfo/Idh/MocA family oxidoreductase [Verrucomicrobiota bacterium]